MATYNVGSGETYTSLQSILAAGVLSDADTVQLATGYSVTESVGSGVTWPDDLIVRGDPLNPSNCELIWDNPTAASDSRVILINNGASGVTFSGLTISYTGSATAYSTCYRGGWSGHSGITFEDCRLNSSGNYGMRVVGAGFIVRRCRVDNSPNTTSTTTIGMYAGTCTVESCLFVGWTRRAMVVSTATINSTTVYSNKAAALLNPSGLIIYITANGSSITNCIVQTVNSVNYHKGIVAQSSTTTGTVKNSIISGFYADIEAAAFTQTNVTTTAGIGSASVLKDPAGGDYYPDAGGLADGAGDASTVPTGGDLNRQAFNSPPSIGCLEILPAPASEPVQPSPTAPYVSAVFMAVDCTGASAPVIVGGTVETWDASQLTATHATAWEVISSLCDWFNDSARGWASSNITATPSTAKMSGGKITISIAFSSSVVVAANAAFEAVAGFGVAFGTTLGGTAAAPCAWSALTTIRNAAQPSPTGGGGLTSGGGWVVGDHPTAPKATEAEGILTPAEAIAMAEALATAPNPRIAHIYNAQAKAFERCKLGAIDTRSEERRVGKEGRSR